MARTPKSLVEMRVTTTELCFQTVSREDLSPIGVPARFPLEDVLGQLDYIHTRRRTVQFCPAKGDRHDHSTALMRLSFRAVMEGLPAPWEIPLWMAAVLAEGPSVTVKHEKDAPFYATGRVFHHRHELPCNVNGSRHRCWPPTCHRVQRHDVCGVFAPTCPAA